MKKQWISVKCGLSRDPKHRRQMGKSVWTFIHMLDLADWETGIVYDWKDENAAEDMGIDVRVLREDRRRLDEEGYITCRQKQYGQDITIHNWTNPREYSGEVYNKKQGDKKHPPSKSQGYAQGNAQGNVKDVTPTLYSNTKDQPLTTTAAEQPAQFVNAFTLYEQNIGPLTPLISQHITGLISDYTEVWVNRAIQEAAFSNVRKIKYISEICAGYKERGSPDIGRSKVKTERKQTVSQTSTQEELQRMADDAYQRLR